MGNIPKADLLERLLIRDIVSITSEQPSYLSPNILCKEYQPFQKKLLLS